MNREKKGMLEEAARKPAVFENVPRVSESRRFFRIFFSRGVVIFGVVIVLLFIMHCFNLEKLTGWAQILWVETR
jgi:hypothetical protein